MRTLAITQNIRVDGSGEMLGDWFNPQGEPGADNSDLLARRATPSRQRGRRSLVGRQSFERRTRWRGPM
jgi:hypothetical protein